MEVEQGIACRSVSASGRQSKPFAAALIAIDGVLLTCRLKPDFIGYQVLSMAFHGRRYSIPTRPYSHLSNGLLARLLSFDRSCFLGEASFSL